MIASEALLRQRVELLQVNDSVRVQVAAKLKEGQRQFFLRQQMAAIKKELGKEEEGDEDLAELLARLDAADMPLHAQAVRDDT